MLRCRLLPLLMLAAAAAAAGSGAATREPATAGPAAPLQIAYGGVLNTFVPVDNADADILEVAHAALKWLQKSDGKNAEEVEAGGCSEPPSYLHPARLNFASKHILRYTYDGRTPAVTQTVDEHQRIQKRTITMGINYHFNLQWDLPASVLGPGAAKGRTVTHEFVVTRDRDKKLSVLSHYTHYGLLAPDIEDADIPYYAILRESGWHEFTPPSGVGPLFAKEPLIHALKFSGGPIGRIAALLATSVRHTLAAALNIPLSACVAAGPDQPPPLPSWLVGASRHHSLDTASPLKLMSYNIWNVNDIRDDTYIARMERLAGNVRESNPDIIAFQEVRHDAVRDSQPQRLSLLLPGYDFVFHPAMSYPERVWHRVEEGVAVFSKYPILGWHYVLLPRDERAHEDAHQRIVLCVSVDTPQFGRFDVLVSHYALYEPSRNVGAVKTWEFIAKHRAPQVFVGDLNAEPDTPAIRFLAGQEELLGQRTKNLFDAWTYFHKEPRPARDYANADEPRDPGLTFNLLDMPLKKRIDFAFVRTAGATVEPVLCSVDTIPRVHQSPPASDHVALLLAFYHPTAVPASCPPRAV